MITKWLKKQGFTLPDEGMRALQKTWLAWYQGYVTDKHRYMVWDGQKRQETKRRTLGMAKVVCEDFASLLVNEHVQLECDAFTELPDILSENKFYTRMNRLAELTMALGTGAIVEFMGSEGKPVIDYIRADMVYPLSWDGDNVIECAFASKKVESEDDGSKTVYYIQLHTKVNGGWQIRNVLLNEAGDELELPEGMQEKSPVMPVPMFQLVRPNTVNVQDFDSPLGASVFAEALEQLYDCDIVWDSYINEFILGKKRLMVPMALSKMMMHKTAEGIEKLGPIFDPNDALFYVYESDESATNKPIELDMNLRTEEHDKGLQRCIDMLSKKCGLGIGRYSLSDGAIETATQVISEKSDLYQSLKRHEKTFGDAIVGMVRALACLTGKSPDIDVAVKFDDSIIEDERATLDRCARRVGVGLMSRKRAIMEIDKVDEKTAEERLQEIIKEEKLTQSAAEKAMYDADMEVRL